MRTVFVKSRFENGRSSHSLDGYNRTVDTLRAWKTEIRATNQQRAYATQAFGAQERLLNSFLFIWRKSDKKEEV